MIAVINDVSFQYTFATKELAMEYMHKFLDICKRIKREEVTNVHEIKTGVIDTQMEISPDFKLIQLLQNFRQEKREHSFLVCLQIKEPINLKREISAGLLKRSLWCVHMR